LVVVLQTGLKVIPAICLLLLDKLAERHTYQSWDIVLVLSKKILEALGSKFQVRLLLGVDHGIALYDGSVDTTVV
jgi:hypothetical protein